MEWDVLEILAAVDERESVVLSVLRGIVVIAEKRIGAVVGYVVIVLTDITEDLGDKGFGHFGDRALVDL